MKLTKLSVMALSLGLILASCGGGKGDAAKTDTAATTTPVAAPAPAKPDTLTAAPAKPDTSKHEEKK